MSNPVPRADSIHHRLYEFVKTALIRIFVHPYATVSAFHTPLLPVCDLYCGGGADAEKWDGAQISHYIGIDVLSSGINEVRAAWESHRKGFTAEFFEADPCSDNLAPLLQEKADQADIVCCLQHLQLGFETEEKARRLLSNVSSLLKPGGYFFGITPDSSTICYSLRSKNFISSVVLLSVSGFPIFGALLPLSLCDHCHIGTLRSCLKRRLAREAGLEYVEIQNLTEFYDDNRSQFAGMIMNAGPNLLDPRGRLLPRSHDVLGDCFDTSSLVASASHTWVLILCCWLFFQVSIQRLYFKNLPQMLSPHLQPPLLQDSSNDDHDEASIYHL
ncbi:hypothetical protein DITRI_Ditri12bG0098700 [Diplodiscus trichospermus]